MELKQEIPSACDPLNFAGCNFTECDHCVLNWLRPHLLQVGENNPASGEIQQILSQLWQPFTKGAVISLGINGQVRFMTEQAKQLLYKYFSATVSHSLPETLNYWLKNQLSQLRERDDCSSLSLAVQIEQSATQLTIRLLGDPINHHYLLLLEEEELPSFSITALELLGLTQREAQVLFWIAKDKTNAGIARLLGCSEGTVRKHSEHLYAKLGVQTRTGAVMIALQKLGLLRW